MGPRHTFKNNIKMDIRMWLAQNRDLANSGEHNN
jgi:hypothetical protein